MIPKKRGFTESIHYTYNKSTDFGNSFSHIPNAIILLRKTAQ